MKNKKNEPSFVGKFDQNRNYSNNKRNKKITQSEKLIKGIKRWTSYYRCYPHKFAEDYLGISLKPFQKILLYCMIHYNHTCFFASRGRMFYFASLYRNI